MDMSNIISDIPTGEIIVKYIDIEKVNEELQNRIKTLSAELNEEAANQLITDGAKLVTHIWGEDDSAKAENRLSESYLILYLKDHGVPVSGGDNGYAHNTDGTLYKSDVPLPLQGEELKSLMLPIIDVKTELDNYLEVVFPCEVENAEPLAIGEIENELTPRITPYITQQIQEASGGDTQ